MDVARRHGLFVLEDAAEAHGAEYKGRRVGSIGDAATFSFFGNKIITTGEGGMVTTNDRALAAEMRRLKNHGMDPNTKYWFPTVGYNYRLTNVAERHRSGPTGKDRLAPRAAAADRLVVPGVPGRCPRPHLAAEKDGPGTSGGCSPSVMDESIPLTRFDALAGLKARGVEGRQIVYPITQLPPYRTANGPFPSPTASSTGEYTSYLVWPDA